METALFAKMNKKERKMSSGRKKKIWGLIALGAIAGTMLGTQLFAPAKLPYTQATEQEVGAGGEVVSKMLSSLAKGDKTGFLGCWAATPDKKQLEVCRIVLGGKVKSDGGFDVVGATHLRESGNLRLDVVFNGSGCPATVELQPEKENPSAWRIASIRE